MSVGAWNVSRGAPRSAALALAAVLSAVLVASCVEGARVVPAGEGADLAHPLSVTSVFSDAPLDLGRIRACQAQLKAEQDAFQKVYDKAKNRTLRPEHEG